MLEGKKSYEQLPCKWLEAAITFQISLDEVSRQETGRGLALHRDSRYKLMPGWSVVGTTSSFWSCLSKHLLWELLIYHSVKMK